jgi:hypothetical protein
LQEVKSTSTLLSPLQSAFSPSAEAVTEAQTDTMNLAKQHVSLAHPRTYSRKEKKPSMPLLHRINVTG